MKKLPPSSRLAEINADKAFAKASDLLDDLRDKNKIRSYHSEAEVSKMPIPAAERVEMKRLEAELDRLGSLGSRL
jgi:hypothetical protein